MDPGSIRGWLASLGAKASLEGLHFAELGHFLGMSSDYQLTPP